MDVPLWVRQQDVIAQGSLTNSKHPDRFIGGIYPTHAVRSSGCYIFDEKNERYADYICGLGTNLVGYANPKVAEAVLVALNSGASPSLPGLHEIEAAEKLNEMFCFVDKWKFLKTGTEACMAAIKIARAYTGRKHVLSQGYHGWSDEFVSLTLPASGVHTCTEIESFVQETDLSNCAAVIIEPIITELSDERTRWLYALREKCTKAGTLLIFDEVITGFRFPKFSVSTYLNIVPDLIIIGKAMANGMPLAAVGGKAKVMDGDYFVSSTYAGDIYSLSACKRVCELLTSDPSYSITKLWDAGRNFRDKFNAIALPLGLSIEGYPTRGSFKGTELVKALFMQEACKAKFLFGPSWFYNFHLISEDYNFFSFLKDFTINMRTGGISLQGRMPSSPFSQRART